MGIRWHSYGWDCPDCGVYDAVPGTGVSLETLAAIGHVEYARVTKSAADHSRNCPALNEVGQPPRDYSNETLDRLNRAIHENDVVNLDLRKSGAYNGEVPDTLPFSDDPDWLEQFSGAVQQPPGTPAPASKSEPSTEPVLTPETIIHGIERILAKTLPHAQKQAAVPPHENYRLDPKDRTSGHPKRPR